MRKAFIPGVVVLLAAACPAVAHANLVLPAIANQFAVSFAVPFYWSVALAVLILVVEAVFIGRQLALDFISSFVAAFLINLATSVLGVVVSVIPFGSGKNIFAYGDMRFGTLAGMVPGYVFTVLVEWGLLLLGSKISARGRSADGCFKTSAVMNLYSYALLAGAVILADMMKR